MNIDKDIERCKELIKTEHSNWIGMSNQDAISNVLLELDKKDEIIKRKNKLLKQTQDRCADILKKLRNRVKEVKKLQQNPNYKALVTKQNKTLEERAETIKFLKSDCETWKKVAEKLAYEILLKTPFGDMSEENIKILIDEVRKEVENGNKIN